MLTERLHACGLRATIQTAFVERINLTLRQSIAGLARRTWSIHIAPSELEMHIRWYQAYYHFCRPHESLRVKYQTTNANGEEVTCFRSRTPMIAAGLTRHRWSVQELLLSDRCAGYATRALTEEQAITRTQRPLRATPATPALG